MNHVQRFIATGVGAQSGLFRVHRAGFVSADFVLTGNMNSAQVEAAIEGTVPVVDCTSSAGFSAGNGTADVTFNNPGHERLYIEKVSGALWNTQQQVAGQSLQDQLGRPSISQITYNSSRLTPPAGGLPAGVAQVNLQIRFKEPGALDSAYSPFATVIPNVNFAAPSDFAIPEDKIIEAQFEVIPL